MLPLKRERILTLTQIEATWLTFSEEILTLTLGTSVVLSFTEPWTNRNNLIRFSSSILLMVKESIRRGSIGKEVPALAKTNDTITCYIFRK